MKGNIKNLILLNKCIAGVDLDRMENISILGAFVDALESLSTYVDTFRFKHFYNHFGDGVNGPTNIFRA